MSGKRLRNRAVRARLKGMVGPEAHVVSTGSAALAEVVDDAVALALAWHRRALAEETRTERRTGHKLASLVADPAGLALALKFVDQVARPDDVGVAAKVLATLTAREADFLGGLDRLLLRLGARLAPLAPHLVVPLARRRLRQLVGHLVVDARDPGLARHLKRSRAAGLRLNLNLLGEAVLGEAEAASRAERTRRLLQRADVDYVSVKVSALVAQISTWDTEGTVARVLDRLRPLYQAAVGQLLGERGQLGAVDDAPALVVETGRDPFGVDPAADGVVAHAGQTRGHRYPHLRHAWTVSLRTCGMP